MKIFDITRSLSDSMDTHKEDYSTEYQNGWRDCLAAVEEKIKNSIEVGLK
jgi:hypothetical protein